jgi:hypothetical protein
MLLLQVTPDVDERQDDDREARRGVFFRRCGRRGFDFAGLADFERVDPDRLGDVLELSRTEIARREVKPPLHLTIGVLGEADRAGVGDALDPCRDIDPVAH